MSYIITARVDTSKEENYHGDKDLVDARILSEKDNHITFDIPAEFGSQKQLTKKMCDTLVDAGFISFEINHSY